VNGNLSLPTTLYNGGSTSTLTRTVKRKIYKADYTPQTPTRSTTLVPRPTSWICAATMTDAR